MAEIHHFDHGWITPTVSYVLSVLGSLLGLICAVRLRSAPTSGWRIWWLSLAAVAIGGTGIWTMHFVAMLGFSVVGSPIRYDVGLTSASAVIAVIAVGVGLIIVFAGTKARFARIIAGGITAGLGVAAMHYTGMAAMRLDGTVDYAIGRVALSIVIAVVAASVALWLTVTVARPMALLISALIMGVAVNGMHFTGMSAMSVYEHNPVGPLAGAKVSSLLIPIGLAVIFAVLGLGYALLSAPTDEDRAGAAYLAERLAGGSGVSASAGVGGPGPNGSRANGSRANGSGANGFGAGTGAGSRATAPGARQPEQSGRPGSALGNGAWTYRDRSSGGR
jgi:NO-binding membrane sensor protein with MHYT domain